MRQSYQRSTVHARPLFSPGAAVATLTRVTDAPRAADPPPPPDDPARAKALSRARKFVETYVAKGPYELYPEAEVVDNVVRGLADNLVAHGRMYCPCAPVEESKQKGSEMVCPCKPHHEDITRQGYCDCALFASPDFVSAERLKKKGGGA